jgi:hypothetical protein
MREQMIRLAQRWARTPSGIIFLAYVGAVLLAVGVLVLGVGLVRRPAQRA